MTVPPVTLSPRTMQFAFDSGEGPQGVSPDADPVAENMRGETARLGMFQG